MGYHNASVDGTDQMYHGTKSSIQDRLPSCQEPVYSSDRKAIILEASPILRKLGNAAVENFYEFAVVFYNYVVRKALFFNRLDVIFDRYFKNSLKSQTREGRGSSGTRVTAINDDVPFPSNFLNSFLCNADNKNDFGIYLASKVISIHRDVGNMNLQICVTQNDTIISVPTAVDDEIFQISSTAEEADQKIVRHALHCIRSGYSDIEVQSIDTDVLVLLLAYVAKTLELMDDSVLNVYFTLVTANPKWFNIISLIDHLGIDICKAFPYFHAFTGCDTVSSFNWKGKCMFFDSWMKSAIKNRITQTMIKLGYMPEYTDPEDIQVLESLVKSVYYGDTKNLENVTLNCMRKRQFLKSTSNDLRKIAPSSDALHMHALRAIHTAGFEWNECLQNVPIPDPSLRGYVLKDEMFVPKWLPNAYKFKVEDFIQTCKCKTAKCTSCNCAKLDHPCLPQCLCNRMCKRK